MENESGDSLAPIPAENGSNVSSSGQEITQNGNTNSSPSTRRRSGFASPDYWTDERRKEKSEWAKQMVAEGRIGGARPGAGRPKKNKTVAEVVSETAQQKSDMIARKLMEMVNHKSPSVSLGAIDRIHTMEQAVQKNMRDDEKELLKLSGKSLDQKLQEVLEEHGVSYDYDLPTDQVEEDE